MKPATEQDASRFWSDGFDMDLLAILPGLKERIGPVGDRVLWTYGSQCANGSLAHPAVWNSHNGMTAYFWSDLPSFERDEHGWVSINGCVTDDRLCQVSVLDAIRDCWCHSYLLTLNGAKVMSMSRDFFDSYFVPIMDNVRGYRQGDVSHLLRVVERWAVQGAENMKVLLGF